MIDNALSLKQNMLWNSVGSIVYLACQWLLTVVVVRLSTDYSAAGLLSLAMSIGNIFTPFAIYKMRTIQVSDVEHKYSAGQYMGFRFLTVFLAFSGCMVYAALTCQPSALLPIALYIAYKAVDIIIDVMHGVDQQHMRMDYIGKSQILRGLLTLVAFTVSMALTSNLELSLCLMIAVTLPAAFFYDRPKAGQFEALVPRFDVGLFVHLLVKCLPAVIAAIMCSAVLTIPRQYLSATFGDECLGIYASVASPVVIVQMGATYLYTPLLGEFSSLFSNKNSKGFIALLVKVSLGIVLIALICELVFALFGEWGLVLLYGESIRSYAFLLQPMIVCTIITAFLWFLSDLLIVQRDFKGNFFGNALSFACTLPATYLFVGHFDMNGVSFAGIAAYGIGSIYLLVKLLKTAKDTR